MRLLAATLAVAGALLSVTVLAPSPARAPGSATVEILYDLGDGSYYWSRVTILDTAAENASLRATIEGAGMHGLWVDNRSYPGLGVAVSDIGQRWPPSGFAGLFLWNRTGRAWELSTTGVSSLILQDGDAIAWSLAAFDSVDWSAPVRIPVPTPDRPTPAIGFRYNGVHGGDIGLDTVGGGNSASEAPNSDTVLWDRNLGVREIAATPTVAYGTVFVTTMDGLFALNDTTGAVEWLNPLVRGFSSPAVFDGTVIAGSSNGRVYRVDARDGRERWNTSILATTGFSGITSSPRVAFDKVYIGTFNESGGPGEVVALWVNNGTVAWRHPTGSIHYSSPIVYHDVVYVGVMGRYNTTTQITFDPPYGLLALYASNGTERWFFRTGGPVAASPLLTGIIVVVPSRDGVVYAVSVADGTERWRADVDAGVSSPAIWGDTIFVGGSVFGGPAHLTALDRGTGAVRWRFVPNGPVQASPVAADGKVFLSTNSDRGTVYALNATTGRVVWSYRPAPPDYILASPAISDGTLFAPSDNGHVYAFRDRGSPLAILRPMVGGVRILNAGENSSTGFYVRTDHGIITNARLEVELPAELEITSTAPRATRVTSHTAEWDIGRLDFANETSFILYFNTTSVAGTVDRQAVASLTYADHDGAPMSPVRASADLEIVGPRAGSDLILWVIAGLGLVPVVVLIVLLVIWRRRHRESP